MLGSVDTEFDFKEVSPSVDSIYALYTCYILIATSENSLKAFGTGQSGLQPPNHERLPNQIMSREKHFPRAEHSGFTRAVSNFLQMRVL